MKVNIVYNKDTDESMTYGFVRFQNPNDALHAMSELNGRDICGKRIKVSFARRGIDTTNCKLYVKRVPPSYSLDDIHKLFSQFGEILEARLLTDNKGHSRQVAFIHYTNRMDADTALMRLSGVIPPGGSQPLVLKYATPPKIPPSKEEPDNIHHTQSRGPDGPHVGEIPTQRIEQEYIPSGPPMVPIAYRNSSHLITVTINGVPPSLDIMTFNFLSTYGKVVEGKVYHQETPVVYGSAAHGHSPQLGIIRFILMIDNPTSLSHILSLEGSIVVVSGFPVVLTVSR
eukprot:CAMPEP_0174817882 /NCGR_PEP_ID=MMETSP1107-20130205/436_1 /TAXON_ID=36770 /ORGANISM="Paraphysomonas vestita, Strain GFlagA" /LENGTH=284 /DNA_ID=CAMNT_0016028979 /DNA_START=135 /DNA_END=989 /DNA_ORIENTATION=-